MTKEEIRALRKSLGLTQEAFAHKIGVSIYTVQNWEVGRRKPSRLGLRRLKEVRDDAGRI